MSKLTNLLLVETDDARVKRHLIASSAFIEFLEINNIYGKGVEKLVNYIVSKLHFTVTIDPWSSGHGPYIQYEPTLFENSLYLSLIDDNINSPASSPDDWVFLGGSTNGFIQNQISSAQDASFRISGRAQVETPPTDPNDVVRLQDLIDQTTASNGLTKTLNNIELGGVLTEDTTLIDSGNNIFSIKNKNTANTLQNILQISNASINFQADDLVTNDQSIIGSSANLLSTLLLYTSTGKRQGIQFTRNQNLSVIDSHLSRGFVNEGDYEDNFIERSLITKQYSDTKFLPINNPIFTGSLTGSKIITKGNVSGTLNTLQEWQNNSGDPRMTFGDISNTDTSPALKIIGQSRSEKPELAIVQNVNIPRDYGMYFQIDSTTSDFSINTRNNNVDTRRLSFDNIAGLARSTDYFTTTGHLGNMFGFKFSTSPEITLFQNSTNWGYFNNTTARTPIGVDNSTDNVTISTRIDAPLIYQNGNQVANLSITTYYTSQNGCISDADISTGSSTYGTNNTVSLQALLDKASMGNPIKIIWDGKYSTGSLTIYSNTIIEVLDGCGAILRVSTNAPMVRNANKAASGTITDTNISINGGIWNFNSTNQLHDTPSEGFVVGFKFTGIKNLRLNKVQLLNAKTFSLLCCNFYNVWIEDSIVDVGTSAAINADGFHFNGPGKNAWIQNCEISSFDDGIAFNADDAPSSYETGGYVGGAITNININNITFYNSLFGIRLLSSASRIDGVSINNIKGNTTGYAIIADNYWQNPSLISPTGNGNFGTININDINIIVLNQTVVGSIKKSYMNFIGVFDEINISNVVRTDFNYNAPLFIVDQSYTSIKKLSLNNISALDTSSSLLTTILTVPNGTISELVLENIYSTKSSDLDAPILLVSGGTVSNVKTSNISTTNILSPIKVSSGTLSNIQASNVTHNNSTPASGLINTATAVSVVDVRGYKGSKISSGAGVISTNTYNDGTIYSYFNQNRNIIGDWSNARNEFAGTMNYYRYLPTVNDGSNATIATENIISKEGAFNASFLAGAIDYTYNWGSGNISLAIGTVGGVTNNGTGTIANAVALFASSPTASVLHPITNAYGLRIPAQKVTGVTLGIGISQEGTTDVNTFNAATNTFTGTAVITGASSVAGTFSVGTTTSIAKLTSLNTTAVTTGLNDNTSITSFSGAAGTGNNIRERIWLRRNTAAGTDWTTTSVHHGIDVDGSFATPGTNTRSWWEQNPSAQSQSWGSGANTYGLLNSTGYTLTGTFNSSTLTASRALVSDGSKNITSSSVTSTELGYLSGVTSAIQTQINTIPVKSHTIFTPTTGGTVNLVNRQRNIINPAGALLALTINLPSSPSNDDTVTIKFTQAITTVTYTGGTVIDPITGPAAGGYVILVYDTATTSWY